MFHALHMLYRIVFPYFFFISLFIYSGNVCAETRVNVTVEGVQGRVLDNVLSYLSIEKHKKYPSLSESLLERLHKKADTEIRHALEPFGYYNPVIRGSLEKDHDTWHARYVIETGNAVLIKSIDVTISGQGAGEEPFISLKNNLPIRIGDVFEHKTYEEAKGILQKAAAERGYFDTEFVTHEVTVDPAKNDAVIILHFNTGMRYRFGEVIFYQEDYDPLFLSRFVTFKKGDFFTLSAVLRLENSFTNSDYFSEVDVAPRRDLAENNEVPIEVKMISRKKHKYNFGIGYGTDTGMRGSAGWENRRINRRGHRMSTNLRLSEIKNSFTATYTVPLKNPATSRLEYSAGWRSEHTDTSESETYLAGISRTHMRGKWQEIPYISYQQERFTVGDETGRSDLLIPGISWTRIKADDRIYTGQGGRLFFDIRGAHKDIVSDATFLQTRIQAKYIYSFGSFGRLIFRGEGGASALEGISDLPASLRFFTGGDRSVRGYAYNSLGPENDKGEVVGGKHLMVGSIEYEQNIIDKWSIAVFYDRGNAVNSLSDSLKEGAGAGIRWRSPVGLVRVDIASALSEPDRPWRLHVAIGPDL